MNDLDKMLEAAAREVLSLVAHTIEPQRPGIPTIWWGADTNCGTDAKVVGEAVAILKRHLMPSSSLTATELYTEAEHETAGIVRKQP